MTFHARHLLPMLVFAALLALAETASTAPQAPSAAVPAEAEAHLGKGYEALKQDRYDVAINEFRAALKVDPALTLRARFPLAVALFESHQPQDARREFETVRREAGDHPNVLYYLGRLDIEERNFASAIENLTTAAADPPFPDTAYYLGFAYLKNGDMQSAEKWLNQAAQANPNDARVPYQLGFVYRKLGRDEEAQKAFALSDQLHQRDDTDSKLRLDCAQKLDQGTKQEAHAACDQLYDANDADKLTELGTLYGRHGDPEDALKPLQRAAELLPQSPQTQYNLALTYFQLNQFEDAKAQLAPAVKRWPDLFPLAALYGATLAKLGDDPAAYDALRRAHQLNPQDSATEDLLYLTMLKLGRNKQSARQYDDSLKYLKEAAQLKPVEPAPHRVMAEIYAATGRTQKATSERQEADRLLNNATRQ